MIKLYKYLKKLNTTTEKYEIIYVNKKGKLKRDIFDNMAMFGWAINGFNASDLEVISYGEIND